MTASGRLVLLVSADSEEQSASLTESLAGWCAAGLLGEVVWLSASELAGSRYSASCCHHVDGDSIRTSLGAAMSRHHREEVWLATLRHPGGPGGSISSEQARRTEEHAHSALGDLLGSGIKFRSLTVQVAATGACSGIADYGPSWDLHLIHESNVEAHESLPRTKAADRAPLSLCAMVALCASGSWRDAPSALELEPDQFDGPTKPVRYVHCQMRVLHTPSVSLSSLPMSPPWPLPQTAGVARAQPEAVPPLALADYLARESGFVCRRPPVARESSHRFGPLRLIRSLLRAVPEPVTRTPSVEALERLAARTGGLTGENEGVRRLRLDGTVDLPDLVRHIERSNFLSDSGAPRLFVADPDSWRTVRETLFGLVDGGALPRGVIHPTRGSEEDAQWLVWTDPKGVAPVHAPPDATDILPEPERAFDHAALRHEVADDSEPEGEPDDSEPEGEPDDSEPEGEPDDSEPPTDAQPRRLPKKTRQRRTYRMMNKATPLVERIVVEQRDTLMERLTDAIHLGLRDAQRGFSQNCALVSVGTEHDDMLEAQKRARRILVLLLLALFFVAVFALDQRWPYLADSWELMTPFEATRHYDPAVWPIGWILIGAVALSAGLALLRFAVGDLIESLRRLDQINADQNRFGSHSSHYASEVLRLYGIAQQFSDHRLIITEFLHRPFGHFVDGETTTLSAADLAFDLPPPHSMLVAYSEVDPEMLEAVRRQRQESAVEPGWLTDFYQRVYSLWSERYRDRFVGEFQGPDHDITERHTVLHRDRHDGSDVFGARTDFAQGVVFDPETDGSGWALHQAAADRVAGVEDSDKIADDYLELFGTIESVHGLQPGIDALTFFRFADKRHRFRWDELLAPAAVRPAQESQSSHRQRYVLADASEGRSLVVAWRLDLSGPVRPQDQGGWRTTDNDDQPTEASRSVV